MGTEEMKYYIAVNGQRKGPFTKEAIKMQDIKPDTLVWHEGMYDWAKAESLYELVDVFDKVPPPLPKHQGLKALSIVMIIVSSFCIAVSAFMGIMGICIIDKRDFEYYHDSYGGYYYWGVDEGWSVAGGLIILAVAIFMQVFSIIALVKSAKRMKQA